MAQLNRYSFAGYYFNQPNVKVRQVTKGSPPLRGSNFIAPGRTGEIWTPKKHGGRMLTLEILVIDEPRGTARMIFDQIQQLAATRTQSALVNYLDSGPRTAQAEVVNWTAQDIDNVGLVFVGQLDFYLADPWFYGATVSGICTPTTTAIVDQIIKSDIGATARSTVPLIFTAVTSGQPIVVLFYGATRTVSSIADTFAGHAYTWTKIDSASNPPDLEGWIGTGGSGTSGTVTITASGSGLLGAIGYSFVGASTAAALAAVDGHNGGVNVNGGMAQTTITPTGAGEIAIMSATIGPVGPFLFQIPPARFVPTSLLDATGRPVMAGVTYLSPTSGVQLVGEWRSSVPSSNMPQFACLLKTTGGAPVSLNVTNTGTVICEKGVFTLEGTIVNPTVLNTTNGVSFTYAGMVDGSLSQSLVVDCGAATVLMNGVSVIGGLTHSGSAPFMVLQPGVNTLVVYGAGTDASARLNVSFQSPWE